MRIALIDRPDPADWPDRANRFTSAAQMLVRAGHDVLLLGGVPTPSAELPILTGLNRAYATAPMTQAHTLAQHLTEKKFDLIVAPLRGGILHGVLMARACGEAFAESRVAVWCDSPTRELFLHGDDTPAGLAPLIADALERQVVMLADALIQPRKEYLAAFQGWKRRDRLFTVPELSTPADVSPMPSPTPGDPREIVFAAPFRRHRGVVEFITVMERMAADGLLSDRIVTFLDPPQPASSGLGQEWLGLRAASWQFPFKIVGPLTLGERLRYLENAERLAVSIAHDPEELLEIRRCGRHHIGILWQGDRRQRLVERLEGAVRDSLSNRPIHNENPAVTDWPALCAEVVALPVPSTGLVPSASNRITVCVLHHNRLGYLAESLASIPNRVGAEPVELLVIDNASDIPAVGEEIRKIAGPRDLLRIMRFETPVPQAFALNRGAAEARHDIVIFHDDDNTFTPTGVSQLATAIARGEFDIVASSLEIFEDGAPSAATAARLIFLGAAHSAGLFFNGFGDTAMAVRRETFLAIGGFYDPGFSYPSLDWVTLARAQSAGLRIGTLQCPAVRYRRNTAKAELAANKVDSEGARLFVFEAYGDKIDSQLVGRYSQKLHLEDL